MHLKKSTYVAFIMKYIKPIINLKTFGEVWATKNTFKFKGFENEQFNKYFAYD